MLERKKILAEILSYLRANQNVRFTLTKILLDINTTVDEATFQFLESGLEMSEDVDTKSISHSRKIFSIKRS